MKSFALFMMLLVFAMHSIGQTECYPKGFTKAEVQNYLGTNSFKKSGIKSPDYRMIIPNVSIQSIIQEELIKITASNFRSTEYRPFDVKDNIIAIGFGNTFTELGILKSVDNGKTWKKIIIQRHPAPEYIPGSVTDTNNDGIIDTLQTNGNDLTILIDNTGMVHAWFSILKYYCKTEVVKLYQTDGLEYWNENFGENNYVQIAAAMDYNGNCFLDFPSAQKNSKNKNSQLYGFYDAGLTAMPSAGIDSSGKIFLCYSSIAEFAYNKSYNSLLRHIYLMTLSPPYNYMDWTFPLDLIPSIGDGGYGEHQEGSFPHVTRNISNGQVSVTYRRDEIPGSHADSSHSGEIVIAKIDAALVGINSEDQNEFYLSQNYPNPVAGMTNIIFSLKKSEDILFEVYDVMGRIVYSENRDNLLPGTHSIALNTSNFKKGIYTYSITTNEQKASRLMILQ